MNKLSLVGMQLPEKCKENFDVSSEGVIEFKRRLWTRFSKERVVDVDVKFPQVVHGLAY